MCALAAAEDIRGDLTITTPSTVKGKPVLLNRRAGGEWSVTPSTAVFADAAGDHAQCEIRYRAMLDRSDFDAYAAAHPQILKDSKPVTLQDLVRSLR
jgi:hypothetical protein